MSVVELRNATLAVLTNASERAQRLVYIHHNLRTAKALTTPKSFDPLLSFGDEQSDEDV
jgi:hypothetical protein